MNGIKTEVEAARLRLCGRSADLQATVCCHSVYGPRVLWANSNRVKTINQLIFIAIDGFLEYFSALEADLICNSRLIGAV